jgi:hypothetical protein
MNLTAQNGQSKKSEIKTDFTTDSLGQLGIRASYFSYEKHGDSNLQLFDGESAWRYFGGMNKREIIKLLGKPNRTISRLEAIETDELDSLGNPVVFDDTIVDRIEYDILLPTLECHNEISYGLNIIDVANPGNYDRPGQGESIGFELYFDCDDKFNRIRNEEIAVVSFGFYLKNRKY